MTDFYNRIHNASNPNQGKDKRVLTVCSAGLLRSPTLANVLHETYGYNTRACGTYKGYALIVLDEVLMHWADEIVFVNKHNYENAKTEYDWQDFESKTIVLNIPDRYPYNHPELRDECLRQYKEALLK